MRRITLGPVALMSFASARSKCAEVHSNVLSSNGPVLVGPIVRFRDFVESTWKASCCQQCKATTQRAIDSALNRPLYPNFGTIPLMQMNYARVSCWFVEYSCTAPAGANQALAVLRQILSYAVRCLQIEKKPTDMIQRNKRPLTTRFLSQDETIRLNRVPDEFETVKSSMRQQKNIVRLLLLTCCRIVEYRKPPKGYV